MTDKLQGTVQDLIDNDLLPNLSQHLPEGVDPSAVDIQTEITIPVEIFFSGMECAAALHDDDLNDFEQFLVGVGVQAGIMGVCKLAIEAQDKKKEQAQ